MVNNAVYEKDQIAVQVDGKTYFGCCEMCKGRLASDASARSATDPVSGKTVDKATAVIGATPDGKVLLLRERRHLQPVQESRVTEADGFEFHEFNVLVRDLDPQGHVANHVYVAYLSEARARFMRAADDGGPGFRPSVVAEIRCRYRSPLLAWERFRVGVRIARLGTHERPLRVRDP